MKNYVHTCGPCSIASSKGSPTERFCALSTLFFTNSSYMVSCTKVRLPALQHCPWLKNKAEWAYSTAVSISAVSAKTILGLFPPSSNVTRFRLEFAAAACIILPTLRRNYAILVKIQLHSSSVDTVW